MREPLWPQVLRRSENKKIFKSITRSSSINARDSTVSSYVLALKNQKFTPLKIIDNSIATRRVSYWDVAPSKFELMDVHAQSPEKIQKQETIWRKVSMTKTSIFENTEASTCDFFSSKLWSNKHVTMYTTPNKMSERVINEENFDIYETPIKKKFSFGNTRTRSKHIVSKPTMIHSSNISRLSIPDSWIKQMNKEPQYGMENSEKQTIQTLSKKKLRLKQKWRNKSRTQNKVKKMETWVVKEKRLNLKNKELHLEIRPYTELKEPLKADECMKGRRLSEEKHISLVACSLRASNFACTPVKVVKKNINPDFCVKIVKNVSNIH